MKEKPPSKTIMVAAKITQPDQAVFGPPHILLIRPVRYQTLTFCFLLEIECASRARAGYPETGYRGRAIRPSSGGSTVKCGEPENAGQQEPADAETEEAPGKGGSHRSPRLASLRPAHGRARSQFTSIGAAEHVPLCPGKLRFGQRPDPSHLVEPLNLMQLGGARSAVAVGLRGFEIADHLGLDLF